MYNWKEFSNMTPKGSVLDMGSSAATVLARKLAEQIPQEDVSYTENSIEGVPSFRLNKPTVGSMITVLLCLPTDLPILYHDAGHADGKIRINLHEDKIIMYR